MSTSKSWGLFVKSKLSLCSGFAITCSKLTIETLEQCEICSKFTIKIPERRHLRRSGIFIVNFEQILHLVLVFQLLVLSR